MNYFNIFSINGESVFSCHVHPWNAYAYYTCRVDSCDRLQQTPVALSAREAGKKERKKEKKERMNE